MDHHDIAFRFAPSDDTAEFSGYAAVWGERNGHNEVIQRGAFAKSLAEYRAAGRQPVMLWSHIPSEIIGVWDEVREDDKGLFVRGHLLTDISIGKDAHIRMKSGAVSGLSIGFRVYPGGEKRSAGTRYLTSVNLAEISVVGSPSAGSARITQVRSHGRPAESAAAFIEACRKAKCALALKGKKA